MGTTKKIKVLQMFYAGALADTVLRMGNEGILDKVTQQKKNEQMMSGKIKAQQLGIQSAKQVFEVLPDIFECADWMVEENDNGFIATANHCMLCAMAKKSGARSPCNIFCLDAMEGLVKGVDPQAEYEVVSTLFHDDSCKVIVTQERAKAGFPAVHHQVEEHA